MFQPTQEQLDILHTFKENRVLKVNSVAGAGKSSTLRLLAENNPEPSLYICFNKVVAEEASEKFPQHVVCKTTHSVAYSTFGVKLRHKMKRPYGGYRNVAYTPAEIAKYFKIQPFPCGDDSEIKANAVASFVKLTVRKYQNSPEKKIGQEHLPQQELKDIRKAHPSIEIKKLMLEILKFANRLWKERTDVISPVMADHDTYMKLWQLSEPTLNYKTIYVDEAQDSNPVLLDVLSKQKHCKIVYVGDTYQSIYEFRNAKNAMELIDAPTKVLSKSFRYGQEIADIATFIIRDAIQVKGLESIPSKIVEITDKPYTKLFRTNAALLTEAVSLVSQGYKVHCAISADEYIKKLKSAEALFMKDYKNVKEDSIVPYSNWYELLEASKEDPELKRIANTVKDAKVQEFINAIEQLTDSTEQADILLTTAHKSKGKEWDNVIVADDFDIERIFGEVIYQQDINLLYVACTRAIKKLDVPFRLYELMMLKKGYICVD